ncbi:MAG TPA: phage baseplate assembly protein V [Thermoanaerobaculia bacterium]|nr:phage baseplate assembly protein V [Thermoanaerobaculia bacterium]
MSERFYGKYRGTVANNIDPMQMGRLQVTCAAVLGEGKNSWALPCAPFAGKGVGFFALPPKGANVWVEFEGGDPDYPIWSGCFWGKGEVPAKPAKAEMKVLKTDAVTLTINDTKGSFTLEMKSPPLKMVFDSKGIELKNGSSSVKLTAASVKINDEALVVV